MSAEAALREAVDELIQASTTLAAWVMLAATTNRLAGRMEIVEDIEENYLKPWELAIERVRAAEQEVGADGGS